VSAGTYKEPGGERYNLPWPRLYDIREMTLPALSASDASSIGPAFCRAIRAPSISTVH